MEFTKDTLNSMTVTVMEIDESEAKDWNNNPWIKTTKSLRKSLGLSKKEFNELTLSELSEYIKEAK